MTRTQILAEASRIVSSDRNLQYGPPEDSFTTIAAYWTVYLQQEKLIPHDQNLPPLQVGMMLALMKVARAHASPGKADTYIDLAGYAACAGGIATAGQNLPPPVDPNYTPTEMLAWAGRNGFYQSECAIKVAIEDARTLHLDDPTPREKRGCPQMERISSTPWVSHTAPGEGYRWLELGEIIPEGAESDTFATGAWEPSLAVGAKVVSGSLYRVKI